MLQSIARRFANGAGAAVRRFLRRKDGSVAIEFGMVAAPFFALLFAIMETAIVFFAGQAQSAGFDAAAFKNAVCAKIYGLFNCQNGVFVDVNTFTSFSNVTMPNPVDGQGNFQNNFNYNPGGPGDVVVVRLFYQYPVYVSLLGFNLSNVNGGKRLLAATAAFRNEPYAN